MHQPSCNTVIYRRYDISKKKTTNNELLFKAGKISLAQRGNNLINYCVSINLHSNPKLERPKKEAILRKTEHTRNCLLLL